MKVKIGQTEISITQGDLAEAEVDAIVNAANSTLSMGAGVAGAIKKKGGLIIEEEAIRLGPIEVGEAVMTTAGNLEATYVLHAAAMGEDRKTDSQKIAEATRSTLRLADEHKLTSLAFPALGTGVGGFPLDEAATAMLTALLRHLAAGPTSLQKVVFVLYQDDAYRVFKETLASLTAK